MMMIRHPTNPSFVSNIRPSFKGSLGVVANLMTEGVFRTKKGHLTTQCFLGNQISTLKRTFFYMDVWID